MHPLAPHDACSSRAKGPAANVSLGSSTTDGSDRLEIRFATNSRHPAAMRQMSGSSDHCCCGGRIAIELANPLSASSADRTGLYLTRAKPAALTVACALAAATSSG